MKLLPGMEISSKVFKNTSEIDLIIYEAIEKKCQNKIQTNLAPVFTWMYIFGICILRIDWVTPQDWKHLPKNLSVVNLKYKMPKKPVCYKNDF